MHSSRDSSRRRSRGSNRSSCKRRKHRSFSVRMRRFCNFSIRRCIISFRCFGSSCNIVCRRAKAHLPAYRAPGPRVPVGWIRTELA